MNENTNLSENKLDLTITPEAIEEIKRLISEEKEESLFLRLGVAAGGCSGMSYSMSFDTNSDENDREFDINGLKVLLNDKSIPYLSGMTLEYKGGLLGGGFNFNNPNAKRSCGCGSSFSC